MSSNWFIAYFFGIKQRTKRLKFSLTFHHTMTNFVFMLFNIAFVGLIPHIMLYLLKHTKIAKEHVFSQKCKIECMTEKEKSNLCHTTESIGENFVINSIFCLCLNLYTYKSNIKRKYEERTKRIEQRMSHIKSNKLV